MSTRTRLIALAGTVVCVGSLMSVAACGRTCRDAALSLSSTEPTTTTVTTTARLTSDGDGVSGKRISFLVDSDGSVGDSGNVPGYAKTNDDGTAVLKVDYLNRIVLRGNRVTRIRAEFSELGGSEAYCDAKASSRP